MADMKFTCPQCQQPITCDELWSGHQIQCPGCQGALTVPPKPAPAGPAPAAAPAETPLVPKPPAATKLSIGQAHKKPEAAAAAPAPDRSIPIRNLAPPPAKKKSPVAQIAITAVVLIAVGVGGYYGYNWFRARQQAKADAAAAAAAQEAQAAAAANPSPDAAAPKEEKPLPTLPPVWTLDAAAAQIPAGRANGSIAGTNFVVETARIDPVGPTQVLRLLQGTVASPDREFLIYLRLKPGEKLDGQTLNISADMKGSGVPTVMKRWKTNPKYAPSTKSFASGYVLKLELGQAAADGVIPGKIFLAVPDKEESVVGGSFKAATTPLDPSQIAQPQQPAAPAATGESAAQRSAYERRYGIRR